MISDFREGGRFSKIGESLCKRAFSIQGAKKKTDPLTKISIFRGVILF